MSIKLEPIDKIGVETLYVWQNDINVKYPLMGFRFPVQKKAIEEWLEALRKDNGVNRVVYGIFEDGQGVGMVSLHDIDHISRKCMFGIYVADQDKRGKGIGSKAMNLILDFAFNGIGLHRVGLEVLDSNENAISLYHKVGFHDEGMKRQAYFVNSKFIDIRLMSILYNEFTLDDSLSGQRLVADIEYS